ncbi:unnamed protein product [Moneuplotes crassus]|uniref:EF-hand domain-containing protein n=1 Tax=Euplotes crassus TaxID=5936 RepID=A0AAD1Y6J2_EUPCR|nr:unnamed protein product [Moneuplotes crassus]
MSSLRSSHDLNTDAGASTKNKCRKFIIMDKDSSFNLGNTIKNKNFENDLRNSLNLMGVKSLNRIRFSKNQKSGRNTGHGTVKQKGSRIKFVKKHKKATGPLSLYEGEKPLSPRFVPNDNLKSPFKQRRNLRNNDNNSLGRRLPRISLREIEDNKRWRSLGKRDPTQFSAKSEEPEKSIKVDNTEEESVTTTNKIPRSRIISSAKSPRRGKLQSLFKNYLIDRCKNKFFIDSLCLKIEALFGEKYTKLEEIHMQELHKKDEEITNFKTQLNNLEVKLKSQIDDIQVDHQKELEETKKLILTEEDIQAKFNQLRTQRMKECEKCKDFREICQADSDIFDDLNKKIALKDQKIEELQDLINKLAKETQFSYKSHQALLEKAKNALGNKFDYVEQAPVIQYDEDNPTNIVNVFIFPKSMKPDSDSILELEEDINRFISINLTKDPHESLSCAHIMSSHGEMTFDIANESFNKSFYSRLEVPMEKKLHNAFLQPKEDEPDEVFEPLDQMSSFTSEELTSTEEEHKEKLSMIEKYRDIIISKCKDTSEKLMQNYKSDLKKHFEKFFYRAQKIDKIRKQFYKTDLYKQKIRKKKSYGKSHDYIEAKGQLSGSAMSKETLLRSSTMVETIGTVKMVNSDTLQKTHAELVQEKFEDIYKILVVKILESFYIFNVMNKTNLNANSRMDRISRSFISDFRPRIMKNTRFLKDFDVSLTHSSVGVQTETVLGDVFKLAHCDTVSYNKGFPTSSSSDEITQKKCITKVVIMKHKENAVVREYSYQPLNPEVNSEPERILIKPLAKLSDLNNQIEKKNLVLEEINNRIALYQCGLLSQINEEMKKDSSICRIDLRVAYEQGYQHGFNDGRFKQIVDQKVDPEQFREGLKEGWDIGFSDGKIEGIRTIFKDAKKQGVDLLTKSIDDYLNDSFRFNNVKYILKKRLFFKDSSSSAAAKFQSIYKEYLSFSNSKKAKYSDKNPKNLLKFIDKIYTNKFKSSVKEISLEDVIFTTFGSLKMTERKILNVLCTINTFQKNNFKIQLFARFLGITDRNYNQEILELFFKCLERLKSLFITFEDYKPNTKISLTEAILLYQKMYRSQLPLEIFQKLKVSIENMVEYKSEFSRRDLIGIDLNQYLDFIIKVFLKYKPHLSPRYSFIFNGWTLFDSSYITWTDFCDTIRIFADDEKIEILSDKYDKCGDLKKGFMTLKEYKKYCLKQLGYRYGNDKIQINKDIFRKLTENTNLFTNEVAEMILLHANYYGTTSEFQQWYYTCTEEEM